MLHIAEIADRPTCTLRNLSAEATTIDEGLRAAFGRRVYYLAADQMFGFPRMHSVAERMRLLEGEMSVRYLGLQAVSSVRGSGIDRGGLSVAEDEIVEVAVFESNIVRGMTPHILRDDDTVVASLFPYVGVLLDEPVELRSIAIPKPTPITRFTPRIV